MACSFPLSIILAAGSGSRMGGPKLFARMDGCFFHEHIRTTLGKLDWPSLWVLRSEEHALRLDLRKPEVACFNRNPEGDMFSSIVCALHSKHALFHRFFLLWPVDFPRVRPDTLRQLFPCKPEADLVIPGYAHQPGHPVLIARHALVRLASSLPENGLQEAIQLVSVRKTRQEISDDQVVRNRNYPTDL